MITKTLMSITYKIIQRPLLDFVLNTELPDIVKQSPIFYIVAIYVALSTKDKQSAMNAEKNRNENEG